jgi:regulator of protease activity HflC (stomatin/prohibitin superfamily)
MMNKNYPDSEPAVMNERIAPCLNGMAILLGNTLLMILTAAPLVILPALGRINVTLMALCGVYAGVAGPLLYAGLRILKPNEALVLTLFGNYHGTLRGPGFFWVNPFVSALGPVSGTPGGGETGGRELSSGKVVGGLAKTTPQWPQGNKKISLKVLTLNNDQQKINDELGNPIIIGIAVIWRVVNTAKAIFNVDNYHEYLSIQCDSALRNIVRLYPYDVDGDLDNEKSLRGSSQEIAEKLREEIQSKVAVAGLEIIEARITHLSYAQEIAAVMLQRQQAAAIIAARQKIVDGAVGMVEMALSKLNDNNIVQLDEERKAAMVSNLMVVLCSNKDAQPIVNSGSLY